MFLLHAFYGLGATVSPLVSTEFVMRLPNRVYLYFCVSCGLAVSTVVALSVIFRGRTDDQIVGRRQPDSFSSNRVGQETSIPITGSEREGEKVERAVHSGGSGGKMKRIMKTPAVHYMAFYILIYVSPRPAFTVTKTDWLVGRCRGDHRRMDRESRSTPRLIVADVIPRKLSWRDFFGGLCYDRLLRRYVSVLYHLG